MDAGSVWPGGALPPTNAEQYAAAEAALQRVYDPSLGHFERAEARDLVVAAVQAAVPVPGT